MRALHFQYGVNVFHLQIFRIVEKAWVAQPMRLLKNAFQYYLVAIRDWHSPVGIYIDLCHTSRILPAVGQVYLSAEALAKAETCPTAYRVHRKRERCLFLLIMGLAYFWVVRDRPF